ncbi:MAG TPA: acyltransferase [Chromatiaceae bacterium]|nr:acyltransferase [Chromatiaceae bacterium]
MTLNDDHTLLGISDTRHVTDDMIHVRRACVLLAEQTHYNLSLFSHRLEAELFDQPPFVEAVRQLATRRARSQIRILISDASEIRLHGHQLVNLAQRLTSNVHIRKVGDEYREEAANFLLGDDAGYLYLPDWRDIRHAQINFNDRLRVRQLNDRFKEMWEHSRPDPALRQLNL